MFFLWSNSLNWVYTVCHSVCIFRTHNFIVTTTLFKCYDKYSNSFGYPDVLMDGLGLYFLFNNLSVISGQWKCEYEGLFAMKRHLGLETISPPGDSNLRPHNGKSGGLTDLLCGCLPNVSYKYGFYDTDKPPYLPPVFLGFVCNIHPPTSSGKNTINI